jgi:hypothetical protein
MRGATSGAGLSAILGVDPCGLRSLSTAEDSGSCDVGGIREVELCEVGIAGDVRDDKVLDIESCRYLMG